MRFDRLIFVTDFYTGKETNTLYQSMEDFSKRKFTKSLCISKEIVSM